MVKQTQQVSLKQSATVPELHSKYNSIHIVSMVVFGQLAGQMHGCAAVVQTEVFTEQDPLSYSSLLLACFHTWFFSVNSKRAYWQEGARYETN